MQKMARRKRHGSNQPIAWTDVWKRIRGIADRLDAPEEIRQAVRNEETAWRKEGDTMYIRIPDNLREYIELHMDEFKPAIWPFLLSHHCKKLIYD